METLLQEEFYFSYGQFMVWDARVPSPGLDWQPCHADQGFARQDSVVNFGVPWDSGPAVIEVFKSAQFSETVYSRVIAVPFHVVSGRVRIEAPDEYDVNRVVSITPGIYCLYAAQRLEKDDSAFGARLLVNLCFCPPCEEGHSRVVVADSRIKINGPLLEFANTMAV